jgi:hypothetical protein
MYGEAMKEALQNKGASLTKDELIITSAGSKAGDRDFYEAAMKEYNKEKHDEYNTLHFADNIVVDDKNLPKVFTPLNDWRNLKRVYKEVTASLDKVRQDSMLSGRNDSDGEESTNSRTVKILGTTRNTSFIGTSLPTKTQSVSAK